jgi:protein subunit release factor A
MREWLKWNCRNSACQLDNLQIELRSLWCQRPRDNRNVIIEIRAGTGGDEAALFASDLLRMYLRYADLHRYKTEILPRMNWYRRLQEVTFSVKGKGAYSRLKFESGVHRVQRVPETEASGRIHTSTVTVAVLAEVEDVEIDIPESDIQVDVYRSAGAGGQNVQKNMTAVRITHLPTGIVVAVRTSAPNCRTGCARWACCAPVCTKLNYKNASPNRTPRAAPKLAAENAAKKSAHTTTHNPA